MTNSRVNLTESVIKQIMEGADPRVAIDQALDEKSGYHKEKRIRDGKAEVVNVKNKKRKVHHTLTPGQKKAIKKAHSAAANKKRAKSIKKGAKMGLYQGKYSRDLRFVTEAEEEELQGIGITCPAGGEGVLEIVDGEDDLVLVCPECSETFVICATSEIEDDDDDADEQEEKDDAEQEDAEEEAPAEDVEEPAEEEAPAEDAEEEEPAEDDAEKAEECKKVCDGDECDPTEESGLFFAAE